MIAAQAEVIDMGQLVDGVWQDDVSRTKDGRFLRPTTSYHEFVTPDGSPGAAGKGVLHAFTTRLFRYVGVAFQ